MSTPLEDRGAIGFGEKVVALLDEGRFTATYKCAVLLGLIDLCLEHTTAFDAFGWYSLNGILGQCLVSERQ